MQEVLCRKSLLHFWYAKWKYAKWNHPTDMPLFCSACSNLFFCIHLKRLQHQFYAWFHEPPFLRDNFRRQMERSSGSTSLSNPINRKSLDTERDSQILTSVGMEVPTTPLSRSETYCIVTSSFSANFSCVYPEAFLACRTRSPIQIFNSFRTLISILPFTLIKHHFTTFWKIK